jgi:oxygen-dependent protoporphyrinogen oxidase
MRDLVESLTRSVEANCRVRLSCPVVALKQSLETENRVNGSYSLTFADGTEEDFDAVIVASTAARTADLLASLDTQISQELRGIEFASSALVISGHRLSDIRHPLNAFGLVIPNIERRRILAVSFSSRKFPNRAPEGRVLLRTFVGGALQPDMFDQTDEQLQASVLEELNSIFGVAGEPDFVKVFRYPHAMPQYHVGHLNRIARIEALTKQHPQLAMAGITYRGVGMPDVVADAERAAAELFDHRR